MLTTLRKIGNSKGIIIPAALLSACDFADTVELRLEGIRLVIEPVKAPRRDWFQGYDAARDIDAWGDLPPAVDFAPVERADVGEVQPLDGVANLAVDAVHALALRKPMRLR